MELGISKVIKVLYAVDATLGLTAQSLIQDYKLIRISPPSASDEKNQIVSGLRTAQYLWVREQLFSEWSLQVIIQSIPGATVFVERPKEEVQSAKSFVALFSTPLNTNFCKPVRVRDDVTRIYWFECGLVSHWRQKCLTCDKIATLRCSGCQRAWFCSTACQQQSWGLHKINCFSTPTPPSSTAVLNQLFRRLIAIACFPHFTTTTSTLPVGGEQQAADIQPNYAHLFTRRLHRWEESIETKLLLGLCNELLAKTSADPEKIKRKDH